VLIDPEPIDAVRAVAMLRNARSEWHKTYYPPITFSSLRQYCRREKEIRRQQRQRPVAEKPPQSPGVTAANFSAKFLAKFFGESWVAFHGTGVLGDAPLGPPPGLEVDLIRLTTPAVTHEWSVANVDALTRNGVNSAVAHPPA
jgi:hypothetical protein